MLDPSLTQNESQKTILAIGGAGFFRPQITKYILSLSKKENPLVCFVGTGSGDSENRIYSFHSNFRGFNCRTTHLGLFSLPQADLKSFLLKADIVYVGGGNTKSLLALWREWELDKYMLEAFHQGIVLCGSSAGAICWFEQGATDSIPQEINGLNCLGFLEGSCCPHFDSEPLRLPRFKELVQSGTIKPGYALDDCTGLLYHGTTLDKIVSFGPTSHVYYVTPGQKEAEVKQLKTDLGFFGESAF